MRHRCWLQALLALRHGCWSNKRIKIHHHQKCNETSMTVSKSYQQNNQLTGSTETCVKCYTNGDASATAWRGTMSPTHGWIIRQWAQTCERPHPLYTGARAPDFKRHKTTAHCRFIPLCSHFESLCGHFASLCDCFVTFRGGFVCLSGDILSPFVVI